MNNKPPTHPVNTAKTIDQLKPRVIVDPIQEFRNEYARLKRSRPAAGTMPDWRLHHLEGFIDGWEWKDE